MATPSAVFTEMVSTTLRHHPSEISDNVSKHNALWWRLNGANRIKVIGGGYEIVRPLDYAENSTFKRYSGYEQLDTGASDVITSAKYDWKQAAVNVTASGLELRNNSSREQIIDLAEARVENSLRTMGNNLSIDMYSDGTADGGKQMGGLQQIVTQNGQGTVGGIDSSTFTFWRNQFQSVGAAITKDNIVTNMNTMWLNCVRGADAPDTIVSDNPTFSAYWESRQELQRYGDPNVAEAGFMTLKYVGADYIHDGGSGIPANTQYMLNTEYLWVYAHRDANMSVMDEKVSVNQDAVVVPVLWQGNLVCSNRARQGNLFGT